MIQLSTMIAAMAFSAAAPGTAPYFPPQQIMIQEGGEGGPGADFDAHPTIVDYAIADCDENTPWQALHTLISSVKVEWDLQTDSQTRMEVWAVDDVMLTEWPLGEIIRTNPTPAVVTRSGTVTLDPSHIQPYHHSFYTGGDVVLQLECRYFSRAFGVIGAPWTPGTIKRFNFKAEDLD